MQNTPIGAKDSLTLQLGQGAAQVQAPSQAAVQAPISAPQMQNDVVETSKKPKKEKKMKEPKEKVPFRQKFLNFIASFKKAGVNISEYGKGFFKGIGKSAIAGVATVGALFTGNQIVKAIKQNEGAGKVIGAIFKNTTAGLKANFTAEGIVKTLKSKKGKGAIAAAVLVGVGAMIKTLYDTTLVANKRKHDIDEKYQKTPAILKK